ncbi:type I restriction enzyme S subunit [Treponema rectale]|uniref:Type I restriction enzyme S subunit n=1 Tax=Treponema rectale TaxID=744512 RepID=A0A840SGQ7_9SPIR|nr:restriction endonuclease subunit S [Treponema rectale]MBB5219885.1 type I restriction enzyme S subunit [Treponema rectale]
MAASKIENAPWVRLGDYIIECDERNSNSIYGIDDVRGISIEKKLIFTKADMNGVSLSPYKIMKPNDFCYVTVTSRNGNKISLAMNDTKSTFILSSSYIVFRSKDENILLPEYLYLLLSRTEFDRYSRFNSWGSARETFDWSEMCRVKIPLPSIETQRELVAVYNGLKELAEENEKLLEPLSKSCEAFIVDCKKKYAKKRLGDLIAIDEKINSENRNLEFLGINRDKSFMPSVATTEGLDKSKYKVISKGKFVFSGMQTGRDVCIRFGLYNETVDGLVSPAYTTYSVVDKNILPEYLMMNFKRSEMDRLGWFLSDSSVRSNLDFDRFHDIQIPIPLIQIQQKIVDLYNCYEECKRIANEAREKISNLCPALVQKAAHSR